MVPGSSPALGMCQIENGGRGCVSPHFLWVHTGHPHPTGGPGAQGGGSGLAFGAPAVDPAALDPSRADLSRAWLHWNKLGGTSPFSEGHPAVGSGDPFPSLSWDKTLLLGYAAHPGDLGMFGRRVAIPPTALIDFSLPANYFSTFLPIHGS